MTGLVELGHEREVEFQAGRGEWFCALERARLLGDRRQYQQAPDVLDPHVATGWWPAAEARAEGESATSGRRRRGSGATPRRRPWPEAADGSRAAEPSS
ncbi:hypothetical protein ACFY00_17850 [Kitasatospora sp. NPDC001540]|uniref:hypothetical protein n=1 Tax=Kitasatospora sp. NPDC001540 TaxID=3364014 RepID=UPI003688A7AD